MKDDSTNIQSGSRGFSWYALRSLLFLPMAVGFIFFAVGGIKLYHIFTFFLANPDMATYISLWLDAVVDVAMPLTFGGVLCWFNYFLVTKILDVTEEKRKKERERKKERP